jgi:hypothetical protein
MLYSAHLAGIGFSVTPSVVRRASLVFVVIQASGVAAQTGAASVALSTKASTPFFIQNVLCIIFFLCFFTVFLRNDLNPKTEQAPIKSTRLQEMTGTNTENCRIQI